MSYLKTKGIVIREANTGEADRVVTILSQSHGKISGFAKGSRRPKNRVSAGTQFLCYSEFILFKGKDMYTVSSCDIIEPFYNIRNDLVKLTYSAHMVDLINDVIQENQPSTKILQLFLNVLHLLDKTDKSPELLTRIFEFRFLTILGYAPYVRSCSNCGKDDFADLSFSFKKCGFLCSECKSADSLAVKLSPGACKALNHIVYSRFEQLFNFELSQGVLDELGRISQKYLKDRLEREYKKLDFLKSIQT